MILGSCYLHANTKPDTEKKMKSFFIGILSAILLFAANVSAEEFNYDGFAKEYFAAWNKTQMPEATPQDLEDYLSLLTDDVAMQHLPYAPVDTRETGGKDNLRKGMSQWLGSVSAYEAKLVSSMIDHNVIILQYTAEIDIKNTETGKTRHITRPRIDVLEIDDGKVAIIRKYGK
jgi:ketosteroid isomerase-like protein